MNYYQYDSLVSLFINNWFVIQSNSVYSSGKANYHITLKLFMRARSGEKSVQFVHNWKTLFFFSYVCIIIVAFLVSPFYTPEHWEANSNYYFLVIIILLLHVANILLDWGWVWPEKLWRSRAWPGWMTPSEICTICQIIQKSNCFTIQSK